jgi:transposase
MTKLLNLPGIIVESSLEEGKLLILSVSKAKKSAVCPNCGKTSDKLHQNQKHLVKDLPMGEREIILNVNRRRFKCKKCQTTFSEKLDFVGHKKGYTHRYAEKIAQEVIASDVSNVAKNNGLSNDEVNSMLSEVAKRVMPIDVKNLKRLGIDEISLVKGQGKFIVVLVDIDTGKLIGLVKERKQKEIEAEMKKWGQEVLTQIEEVSIDMTGNYKSLVKKICPNASVTVDRFHVAKIVHNELNQARIEQKKIAASLEKEEREKIFNSLNGNKYTLLKAEKDLTESQKKKLEMIRDASPLIAAMHGLKEKFTSLFEESKDLGSGTINLADWVKKAQGFYQKSVKTIKGWFAEIVGYFDQRTTSGVPVARLRVTVTLRC